MTNTSAPAEFTLTILFAYDFDLLRTPAPEVETFDTYAEAFADFATYVREENFSMEAFVEDGAVYWRLMDADTDVEVATASIA